MYLSFVSIYDTLVDFHFSFPFLVGIPRRVSSFTISCVDIPFRYISNTSLIKSSKKYRRLTELLTNAEGKPVSISFGDIEKAIGFSLPDSAREHRAFWANTTTHSIALSWLSVGYKTVDVDLEKEIIVFEK